MDVSIIIVNYNVKYFLEQCLYSVQQAITHIAAEVIIIDNASTDGSVAYLQPLYPQFIFLPNANEGFGKACNRGLARASGKYILFLNPDTLVPENIFDVCLQFFNNNKNAGATGVKMLDGSGNFLKESKRAFPGVMTSFYKLFGLSFLFPHSPLFSRYHLGHLDKGRDHEVQVLSGAFMMVRKDILDSIGGFDEAFYMYGEDIDLSYRIVQSGYKNYYLAQAPIIHFKGESTVKRNMNYIKMFYKAMQVFVNKHYAGSNKILLNNFIHIAIRLRAGLAVAGNAVSNNAGKFLRKKNKKSTGNILVVASPETWATVQKIMPAGEAVTVANPWDIPLATIRQQLKNNGYKSVIFCQGEALSYAAIIACTEGLPAGTTAFFHGRHTQSMVSSHAANTMGESYAAAGKKF